MSLLFMDGFDSQDLSKWTMANTVTFTTGRVGGYSANFNAAADQLVRPFTPMTTASFGIAVQPITVVATSPVWGFRNTSGATEQLSMGVDSSGWRVGHYIGGSTSMTYTNLGPVTSSTWVHFEVTLVQHLTTGSVLVKMNGVTVYSFTGDTLYNNSSTSTHYLAQMYISGNTSTSYNVDDIWVSTGETYGDCRVRGLMPTGDGATKQWTPSTGTTHWSLVDEVPPSMTDYVSAATAGGLTDTFTVTVPGDISTVSAVQVSAVGLKTDAGIATVRMLADGQESPDYGLGVTAGGVFSVFPTASGAAAWTPAKVASSAFGIKAV